jgi:hypothetical protein
VEQGSRIQRSSSASFKNIGSSTFHHPPADNGGAIHEIGYHGITVLVEVLESILDVC